MENTIWQRWPSDPVSLIYFLNCSSQTDHLRCFPHVINIACQAIIKELKKSEEDISPNLNAPPVTTSSPGWLAYKQAILANPIGKKQGLVAACRSLGQCRRQLKQTIIEGNLSGYWKGKLPGGGEKLHWSTFCMIARLTGLLHFLWLTAASFYIQ